MSETDLPNAQVLRHVVDVHCHPTDAGHITSESMDNLAITICAMSTMQSDQSRVRDLANAYPDKVIPCFGYHPWFTYSISISPTTKEDHYKRLFCIPHVKHDNQQIFDTLLPLLPDPRPLEDVLTELRENLELFPDAMLGEVGLDRLFRVPYNYHAAPRDLTPFTVPLEHQLSILEAQLDLAVELQRNVSIHSVKAQAATVDLLLKLSKKHGKAWNKISIDMHSCGLSPETWRQLEIKHRNVFVSLSTVINSRHSTHRDLIRACSSERLLVESDYNDVNMCMPKTWDMLQIVAEIKGWTLETDWQDALPEEDWGAVRKLEANWHAFKTGNH